MKEGERERAEKLGRGILMCSLFWHDMPFRVAKAPSILHSLPVGSPSRKLESRSRAAGIYLLRAPSTTPLFSSKGCWAGDVESVLDVASGTAT